MSMKINEGTHEVSTVFALFLKSSVKKKTKTS